MGEAGHRERKWKWRVLCVSWFKQSEQNRVSQGGKARSSALQLIMGIITINLVASWFSRLLLLVQIGHSCLFDKQVPWWSDGVLPDGELLGAVGVGRAGGVRDGGGRSCPSAASRVCQENLALCRHGRAVWACSGHFCARCGEGAGFKWCCLVRNCSRTLAAWFVQGITLKKEVNRAALCWMKCAARHSKPTHSSSTHDLKLI